MNAKQERSVGVIPVYKKPDGDVFVCLVRSVRGDWGFPKGHLEGGETDEQAAHRELFEETGIGNIALQRGHSFSQSYMFKHGDETVQKTVDYYLGFTDDILSSTPKQFEGEIMEVRWFSYEDAKRALTFDDTKKVLEEVWQVVQKRLE